jgi:hypothetical protein
VVLVIVGVFLGLLRVVRMLVGMFVPMQLIVLVRLAVLVGMMVLVFMRMGVNKARGVGMGVGVSVFVRVGAGGFGGEDVFAGANIDLGAGDATADDFSGFETGADIEDCGDCRQFLERHTGVDEGAKEHVAADAGEAVEVCNTHVL